MGHHHAPGHGDSAHALSLALAASLGLLVLEVVAGLHASSAALLADAAHLLTDLAALALARVAVGLARRPATAALTYGWHRGGILVALANGAVLLVVGAVVAVGSVRRLLDPVEVSGGLVVVTALVALAVNAGVAARLGGHHDLGTRSARLHVLGDVAASAGVLAAGMVVLLTGWERADPLASLAVCLLVGLGAVRIMRETVVVLLEAAPRGISPAAVRSLIEARAGSGSVHDLHVWSLAAREVALSCHLVLGEGSIADGEHLVRDLEQALCTEFGIAHTTIQVESCHPCNDDGGHGRGAHNHPHQVARAGTPGGT